MSTTEPDYWAYKENEEDKHLGKRITVLIGKDKEFVVYLDERFNIQWHSSRIYWPCPAILNQVANLEADTSFITDNRLRREIRALIAEILVRELSDATPSQGNQSQNKSPGEGSISLFQVATNWATRENAAHARRWLFWSASAWTALALVLLAVISTNQCLVIPSHFLYAAMAGALGAWASTGHSPRVMKTVDARTGKLAVATEALARIAIGATTGVLLALLIKAEFVLGAAKENSYLFYAACIIAGLSERFLPALIARVEDSVVPKSGALTEGS